MSATILQNLNGYDEHDVDENSDEEPVHYRLERHLMSRYNNRLIPRRSTAKPIQVLFTIGLYQIIEVNEPQQYILLNSWIVERWRDDLLHWTPSQFGGMREIVLPREAVWIPDTTLYNSLVMDDQQSRRILNVKLNTLQRERSALVEMLYPTLYQFSCMLDLRFFPYDIQHCVMMFGSWSHDNTHIDYFAYDDIADAVMPSLRADGTPLHDATASGGISIEHCIPNEGWNILSTEVSRREVKFHCCENNYTLLEFKLHIQRRPLFYLVNLIIPTSIITLIAIVGFFSSSTVNDVRDEKISLGITTLLSMSILIFMVSDQMPSTSSFIPLIGWFYTSMMALISGGTLAASFVIYVQKMGIIGQRPSRNTMRWARRLGKMVWMEMPLMMKQAYAIKAKQDKIQKIRQHLELQHQKLLRRQQQNGGPNQQFGGGTSPRKPTFWQLRPRIAGTGAGQQQNEAAQQMTVMTGLGTAGTAFVGPTLGHAMSLLMPRGTGGASRGAESPPLAQKVSQSINEEASDDLHEEGESSSDMETTSLLSAKDAPPSGTVSKKHSGTMPTPEGIAMIDMEEEQHEQQQMEKDSLKKTTSIRSRVESTGQNGPVPMNLENPLVANVACVEPLKQWAQQMLERQRELERTMGLNAAARKRHGGKGPTPLHTRRSTSYQSMADLYAASMLPTPAEPAAFAPTDTGTTLAEASATLAALHPQVQRNLAEIEYDWLAAVVERMFLILFW
uniref:Neur_chan_LBD domain-containing protein n=1 Tax=Globodera pallida TaxID=36090 RepID=A0A183CB35_GLOPA